MIFESANDTLLMGGLRITRLSDGHVPYTTEMMVANAPKEEADAALDAMEAAQEQYHRCFRVTCLLVQDGTRNVLVDTGWGRWPFAMRKPDADPVTSHLAKLGLAPEDIDLVVTSHAHPDHIGGNVLDVAGELRPAYPKARYRLHKADWDFYTTPERLESSQYFAKNLPPLDEAGVLDLFDDEHDAAPGIRVLPAPGHSPGNCVIVITGGNEMAVYLGDVAHHPIHLEHPDWNAMFDVMPEMARGTRRWLYERIAREQPWVIGCHFVSPGIGKLESEEGGYRWKPWQDGGG